MTEQEWQLRRKMAAIIQETLAEFTEEWWDEIEQMESLHRQLREAGELNHLVQDASKVRKARGVHELNQEIQARIRKLLEDNL